MGKHWNQRRNVRTMRHPRYKNRGGTYSVGVRKPKKKVIRDYPRFIRQPINPKTLIEAQQEDEKLNKIKFLNKIQDNKKVIVSGILEGIKLVANPYGGIFQLLKQQGASFAARNVSSMLEKKGFYRNVQIMLDLSYESVEHLKYLIEEALKELFTAILDELINMYKDKLYKKWIEEHKERIENQIRSETEARITNLIIQNAREEKRTSFLIMTEKPNIEIDFYEIREDMLKYSKIEEFFQLRKEIHNELLRKIRLNIYKNREPIKREGKKIKSVEIRLKKGDDLHYFTYDDLRSESTTYTLVVFVEDEDTHFKIILHNGNKEAVLESANPDDTKIPLNTVNDEFGVIGRVLVNQTLKDEEIGPYFGRHITYL